MGKPVHRLEPGGQAIAIQFCVGLIEYWKYQHQRGKRAEIPRELWDPIDELLGVNELNLGGKPKRERP